VNAEAAPLRGLGRATASDLDPGASLARFLELGARELVAFVGAGGKTTLMLALGRNLAAVGRRVLFTTTTRVGARQVSGVRGFWFERRQGGKLVGPPPEAVDRAWATGAHDVVLVEADGARGMLAKAPAPYEPVIPALATVVVAVIAADALARPIDEVAHRPDLVAAVVGCSACDALTEERAARLVTAEAGLHKGVRPRARFVAAITRVDPEQRSTAAALASRLKDAGVPAALFPRTL